MTACSARAGSGAATFTIPDSLGVPVNVVDQTVVVPFNDLQAVRGQIEENPNRLAAVVVEPIAGNMGVVPPKEGFLAAFETYAAGMEPS